MRRTFSICAILLAFLAACSSVAAQQLPAAKSVKAIRLAKLWDGQGKLWSNAIVIVDGDKIRAVTTDASTIPAGAERIDLSKYTGLPGLIDVHTHMTMYTEEARGVPALRRRRSDQDVCVNGHR